MVRQESYDHLPYIIISRIIFQLDILTKSVVVGVFELFLTKSFCNLQPNVCRCVVQPSAGRYLREIQIVSLATRSPVKRELQSSVTDYIDFGIRQDPYMMMYLLTTVPHPHGHWQLQELLGNMT